MPLCLSSGQQICNAGMRDRKIFCNPNSVSPSASLCSSPGYEGRVKSSDVSLSYLLACLLGVRGLDPLARKDLPPKVRTGTSERPLPGLVRPPGQACISLSLSLPPLSRSGPGLRFIGLKQAKPVSEPVSHTMDAAGDGAAS